MTDPSPLPRSWPALAALAGLPADGAVAMPLPERGGGKSGRRDWRVEVEDGAGRRALRLVEAAEGLGDWAAAQRSAWVRMGGDAAALRLPRVLATLPDGAAALLALPAGETAADRIEAAESHAARREVLGACGRWLAAFHRTGKTPVRPYQTRFVTESLRARRARLRQTGAPDEAMLDRLIGAILAGAAAFDGLPARHAPKHGAMGLDQLVFGADAAVTGLGLGPAASAPVGHDVARLLVDYAVRFADPRAAEPGELLARPDRVGFFKGYDLAGHDDAAIGFLAGVEVVNAWAALPKGRNLSLDASLTLAALRATALRLFPEIGES